MSNLLRYVQRNTILVSLLINAIIFVACFVFSTPRFQTNDDIAIIFSLRGVMNFNESSALILYSNPLWTFFVKFLYDYLPFIQWYPFLLEIILLVANVCLTIFLLKKNHASAFVLIIQLLALLAVTPFLYLYLQFTIVAAFVSAVGFFIFLLEGTGNKWMTVGLLLIFIAALIRFEAILLSWLLVSLFYLFETWRTKEHPQKLFSYLRKLRWVKLLAPVLIFGAISFSGFYFLPKPYMESLQYNWLRAGFNEYDQLGKISEPDRARVLSSAGFSENDYRLMQLWFCEDSTIYSLQRLKNLNSVFHETGTHSQPVSKRIVEASIGFWRVTTSHPYLEFLLLSLIILAMSSNMRYSAAYLLISICIIAGYYIFIYVFFKPPAQRVYAGYFYFLPFLMLWITWPYAQVRVRHIMITGVALFFSIQALRYLRALSLSDNGKTSEFLTDLSSLRPFENKKLILVGNALKYETVPAFSIERTFHFSAYSIGSLSVMPHSRTLLDKYKLQNLAYSSSRDSDCFFVVSREQLARFAPAMIQFTKEHYRENIRENLIQSASTFVIVQFNRDSTAF